MRTIYQTPAGSLLFTDTDEPFVYDVTALQTEAAGVPLLVGVYRPSVVAGDPQGRRWARERFEDAVSRAPHDYTIVATYNPTFGRIQLAVGLMNAAARALFNARPLHR